MQSETTSSHIQCNQRAAICIYMMYRKINNMTDEAIHQYLPHWLSPRTNTRTAFPAY